MNRLPIYAQLVRLPNLPSTISNICLGALATQALPPLDPQAPWLRWLTFLLLLLASACLYCGGMVWNDIFDLEQDKHERPFRPLPSGKITLGEAKLFGGGLLTGGVLFAGLAGWSLSREDSIASIATPIILGVGLVAAILLYDAWLKQTPMGPVSMGFCRFLNVLLGVSVSGSLACPRGAHLAVVVGLYVVGLTWFARTEARLSKQNALRGAAVVMLASLLLALLLPVPLKAGTSSPLFPYLLVAFGFLIGLPMYRAITSPTPEHVQPAVKQALLGLIVLDAILASAVAGTLGLVLLLLLTPAVYLNRQRFLYAT